MHFSLNLSHYVKNCGHFCQVLAFFIMPAHQILSYHLTKKQILHFFLFCLNSTFNIRKSQKTSGGKALYFRSYQPKTSRELEIPSAFRVNGADFHLEFIWLVFSAIDNTAL